MFKINLLLWKTKKPRNANSTLKCQNTGKKRREFSKIIKKKTNMVISYWMRRPNFCTPTILPNCTEQFKCALHGQICPTKHDIDPQNIKLGHLYVHKRLSGRSLKSLPLKQWPVVTVTWRWSTGWWEGRKRWTAWYVVYHCDRDVTELICTQWHNWVAYFEGTL